MSYEEVKKFVLDNLSEEHKSSLYEFLLKEFINGFIPYEHLKYYLTDNESGANNNLTVLLADYFGYTAP